MINRCLLFKCGSKQHYSFTEVIVMGTNILLTDVSYVSGDLNSIIGYTEVIVIRDNMTIFLNFGKKMS